MRKIEKLNTDQEIQFNKVDLNRKVRTLFLKVNEIIDVINEMNEPPYMEDYDEDDEEDDEVPVTLNDTKRIMSKKGSK